MASSPDSARQIVRDSIRFDKIEVLPPSKPKTDWTEDFKNLMDNLGK